MRRLRIALWLGLVSVTAQTQAKIYSYVDSEGRLTYTDSKPGAKTKYNVLVGKDSKVNYISTGGASSSYKKAKKVLSTDLGGESPLPMMQVTLPPSPVAEPPSGTTCLYESHSGGQSYYGDSPIAGSVCTRLIRTRPKTYFADLKRMPVNKSKFNELIAAAALRHQVDERLLHAVIRAESAYNPRAESSAGAVGLMQLMPGTARRYGVNDRTDPGQNIDGGTRYLKDLLAMFNSNISLAVAGYNAGEGAVMRYNNSIPPYPETRNYVRQVLAYYQR